MTDKSEDIVSETIKERSKVYGDPKESHTNIGLKWTGQIQHHYGITLDHPLPAVLVAQMLVDFKVLRAGRAYHEDSYVDANAYLRFAEGFHLNQPQVDNRVTATECLEADEVMKKKFAAIIEKANRGSY